VSGSAGRAGASIAALLRDAAAALQTASDSPRADVEILLAHALGWPRTRLIAHADSVPDPDAMRAFGTLLEARRAGTPVAYLTGRREFWSLDLQVSPATLIPRPETERLVELALERLPARGAPVADLGTGCGAIALALAHERPGLTLLATDASGAALQVARGNAQRLGLGNLRFAVADWCRPLARDCFQAVLSNPPYVAAGDPHLARGDLRFEPPRALSTGDDGLADLRRIIADARAVLRPGGWLLLEHGPDQGPALARLLAAAAYRDIQLAEDYAGRPRVSLARRP
jgi:release factor glutamine methyltransferase